MAEIGLDDGGVGRHLRRRAGGDDAAFRQHEDVLGETHHRLHHVLDHQDGDAAVAQAADHRHDVADLRRVQAGQHLVEQQQLRLGRQRPRQLQPLAAGDGQRIGRPVEHVGETDLARHLFGGGKRGLARAMMQMRADPDVLAHRQPGEGLHDLEGAGDAAPRQPMRRLAGDVLAAIAHSAVARLEEAGDDGEQRGLAGAIGADERGDAALRRRKRHAVDRQQSAETARHVLHRQQRLSHGGPPAQRDAFRRGGSACAIPRRRR